uniref:F-box/LRR-repeat protein 13-like n=1 Tax=Phallusia mammillata TaxID=59560 RepID=A0A6F9DCK7_9ASCI|nr:F-box/LRR-repeat protein 13-like [Phallusia mammillata]
MTSIQGIDPKLKEYIRVNQLPDIYECLLTGLIVLCPDDPLKWIVRSIKKIETHGLFEISWDMFVPPEMRPNVKQMAESYLDEIFTFGTGTVPTSEMFATAYNHYHKKIVLKCFKSWSQYFLDKRQRKGNMMQQLKEARRYYRHRNMRITIEKWKVWKTYVLERQNAGFKIIVSVCNTSLCRLIFRAWRAVAVDARKTREYFERLERGELEEESENEGTGSSDNYRDDISLLPRRCAIEIFSCLDLIDLGRCAQVCRAWKVITGAPSLWSHLNFGRVRNSVSDKSVIQCLQKCRPYLVHLNLRQCYSIHWPSFKAIAECANLQDLNLSECKAVNDEVMRTIAEGCPTLLYLNLSHTEITDGTLRTLSRCCLNMQYLSLAYCTKYSDRGLHYLAAGKGCRKLTYLDVSGCLQITSFGFRHVAQGCTNMQSLFFNDMSTLNDACITNLAEKCTNIRAISLLGSPNISDHAFKVLANAKRLQKLRIEGNQKISDNTFKALGKQCPYLCHLYVVDCQKLTDMMLKALSPLRNIVVLNIADCVRVSDSGVRQLVEGPSGAKIRELNLTNCVRVSDVSLLRVAQRCHSLTHLCLCFCEHVTDAGIELLGNMPCLSVIDLSGTNIKDQGLASLGVNNKIRSITLSECSGISDLGLQKFCQQVKELESLDVSHCMALSDSAIKNLAFCCRMLTGLNVAGCPLLTDLSIQYLSGVCHYIHVLNLSGCIYISDRALKYLRKGCKQLRSLTILYCRSITKLTAQRMHTRIEHMEYSNENVPTWYNYDDGNKRRTNRLTNPGQNWIDMDDD